jgi:hypothetical protein
MARNGKRRPARPRIELRQAAVSPPETAAIAAAIEQFLRDTAPPPTVPDRGISPWLRAALLEGTRRAPIGGAAWGDEERWGSS